MEHPSSFIGKDVFVWLFSKNNVVRYKILPFLFAAVTRFPRGGA
jgi:hypothetical protein